MRILVILELEEVGGEWQQGQQVGLMWWSQLAIESFCGRRGQGEKLDLLLRTRECCFTYYNGSIFETTWTGDTHVETNILPDSGRDNDSQQSNILIRDVQGNTYYYRQRIVDTRLALTDEGSSGQR